jgi:hypothetical protein
MALNVCSRRQPGSQVFDVTGGSRSKAVEKSKAKPKLASDQLERFVGFLIGELILAIVDRFFHLAFQAP